MSTALYGDRSFDDNRQASSGEESENQTMLSNSGVNTNMIFNSRLNSSKGSSSAISGANDKRHKKLD
jgi:hypothetical protein